MAGIDIDVSFPELESLVQGFRALPKRLAAKYIGAALRKAIAPGAKRLKQTTPRGPTGNLRRAIAIKVKRYTKGTYGNAVALAGFRAPPKKKAADLKANEKGYHQGWLEFGTKERKVSAKSRRGFIIASSWNNKGGKRGGFSILPAGDGKLRTTGKHTFFRAAKRSVSTLTLKKMPVGGRLKKPPVRTAYEETISQQQAILRVEMTKGLQNAIRESLNPRRRPKK
jgi:hypothetical protein